MDVPIHYIYYVFLYRHIDIIYICTHIYCVDIYIYICPHTHRDIIFSFQMGDLGCGVPKEKNLGNS